MRRTFEGIRVDMLRIDSDAGLRRELEIGVRLAPTRATAAAAAKAVAAHLDRDAGVPVRLAGLDPMDNRLHITLAVTLGTIDEVKAADPRSRAALTLLQRLVDELACFEPALVTLPRETSSRRPVPALLVADLAVADLATA